MKTQKTIEQPEEERIEQLDSLRFNGIYSINESRYKVQRGLNLCLRTYSFLPSERMLEISDILEIIIEDTLKEALSSYVPAKKAEEEYFRIQNKPIKGRVDNAFKKFSKLHSQLCENYYYFSQGISNKKQEEFQRAITPKSKYKEVMFR